MQLKRIHLALLWIVLATLGRLIPHPANFTPMNNICLFAGSQFSRSKALLATFIPLILSDILLALIKGYPFYGSWMIFNYSAYLIIILLGTKLKNFSWKKLIGFVIASSLGFWLWTNFGVWMMSGMYLHTLSGLFQCYIAALPFLQNSLIGDLVWMVVIFGSYIFLPNSTLSCSFKRKNKSDLQ